MPGMFSSPEASWMMETSVKTKSADSGYTNYPGADWSSRYRTHISNSNSAGNQLSQAAIW